MNVTVPGTWLKTWGIILLFILAKLLFHFVTNTNYELHRDSFLYIEQGKHLAWGYASTPPSIAVFAEAARFIFGDTTFGIRFFPALVGALSILLIGTMVRQMGGGVMALVIACTAFLVSPAFLRSNTLFQPVAFNQFYWLLTHFLLFRLIRTNQPFYWILIGIVSGLGILNKHSILVFQAALFLAFAATHHRRWLKTWYPWAGLLITVLMVMPHITWQHAHGWPLVRHMKELSGEHLVHVSPGHFISEQFLMNLPGILVWMAGLYYLVFRREAEKYMIIGLSFLFTMGILIILSGKHYYTLGLYPVLFAFGGCYLERLLRYKLYFLNYVLVGFMILVGALLVPVSLPVLKPDKYIRFMKKIGMEQTERWEDGQYHDLPQDYADMIGWKELAGIVIDAYRGLDPDQQARCSIFANNYGEAGAVNFYGSKYGLPGVVSFHDSFILWAPDKLTADYLIKIGSSDNLQELYHQVEAVGRITSPHARQEGTPVYLCSKPKIDINAFYQEELAQRRHP